MNIGIVTSWFERGAAYVSRQYCEILAKYNNVFIYARGGENYAIGEDGWDNKNVTWGIPGNDPTPTALNLSHFKKWIFKNKLNIVFFNEQHWWPAVIFCNKLNIKCGAYIDYYTEESVPFHKIYDFLICNTLRHFEVFSWHPQCYYIPWGTNTDLFKPNSAELVNKKSITFFHSAGMSPGRKGTDVVLKAFYNLKKANLLIHSQVNIKKIFPQMETLIVELIKEKRLEIITKTIPAPGLYYKGDVYIYPSVLEGIGLSIAEALSCGLPVITSNNPPMNEFIHNNENGFCIKIDRFVSRKDGYYWPQCYVNVNDLTDKMQWYVENSSLIPQLKRKARLYAETNLDWFKNSKKINDIFLNIEKVDSSMKLEASKDIQSFIKSKPLYKLITLLKPWWLLKANINYFKILLSNTHTF